MGIFLGRIFVFTAGIAIILWSQLSFFPGYKLNIVENSLVNKICKQDLTINCPSLLSMSNGRPVSEIDYPMKITFRQSGGYAGLTKGCEINTELLSSEEAQEIKSLVAQSGILEAQSKQSPNVADAYNYLIIIETRERTHQVSFDELSLPRKVIPLIDFLEDRSDYIKRN